MGGGGSGERRQATGGGRKVRGAQRGRPAYRAAAALPRRHGARADGGARLPALLLILSSALLPAAALPTGRGKTACQRLQRHARNHAVSAAAGGSVTIPLSLPYCSGMEPLSLVTAIYNPASPADLTRLGVLRAGAGLCLLPIPGISHSVLSPAGIW